MYHVLESLEPRKRIPPVILREDNEWAICEAQNPLSTGRTKGIDFRSHYIWYLVRRDEVKIEYVSSEQ